MVKMVHSPIQALDENRSVKFYGDAFGLSVEHVWLRPYSQEYAEAVIEALDDWELTSWLAALPFPVDLSACEKYLQFLDDPDVFAQVLCIENNFAGIISLGTELSFWIKPDFHRMGLGYWAVRCFLDELPTETNIVTACCMQENKAAAAFLLKLGFVQEGKRFRRFSFPHGHAVEFLRFQWTKDHEIEN